MARRALLAGIALVAAAGLAWAVEPVRTRILIVAGLRAAGETSIGETCEDEALGSGPLPELALPDGASRVEIGQSLQEALDRVGPDGTVVVASGIHGGQSVVPQSGQTILGEPGAILSGEGAQFAFRSASPGVTIRGLVIEGYEPEDKQGVVQGEEGARGWTVSGNEIRNNAEVGIVAKSGWTVTDNRVHHNGRYGIIGSGAQLLIEGNEIACSALTHGSTSDSAATKFVHTTDIVIRNNNVHDNFGNGLWVDINNVDFRIEGNRAEGNAHSGIFV